MGHEHKEPRRWSPTLIRVAVYGGLALAVAAVLGWHFFTRSHDMSLSDFDRNLREGRVAEVQFDREGGSMQVALKDDGTAHTVYYPQRAEDALYEDLHEAGVPLHTQGTSVWSVLGTVATVAFWIVLGVCFVSVVNSLQEMARKNDLDTNEVERPTTRFGDVQGIDEIVEHSREIVSILDDPDRYRKLGARLPKGAILYGPPGTGKTLLARAIAGEADVPFFRVTAASLMDKWLGSSAKRIAKLYAQARRYDAAIVFIDEADAIAGSREHRANSGGDGERNAALTQLLNELDGFDRSGVFTIVATNRLDMLDEAFLRAGRFDRRYLVPPPDVNGREAILRLHTAEMPLSEDVELRELARQTTGAVGADLEALANEAALTASRNQSEKVTAAHFNEALATIEQGPQRKGVIVNAEERRITAYHEAGHTLAALMQERMDDPMRVTIIPRGESGGHTRVAPAEDRQFVSKQFAKAQLVWMMAGRAAEKIACGPDDFTSGAASDLRQATAHALRMICLYGMGTYNTSIPLDTWEDSPQAAEVERQVEELLDDAELAAIELLLANHDALKQMVERLLAEETIQGEALLGFRSVQPLHGPALDQVRKDFTGVLDSVRSSTNGVRVPLNV